MGNLSNAKMLGGIGAIISLIGLFVPLISWFLPIVGLVLILIAVKTIADNANNHDIFKNYLIYFIMFIIALIAMGVIFVMALGAAGGMDWINQIQSANITDMQTFMDYFDSFIIPCISAVVIGWILLIIGSLFYRKSYNAIAEQTNVNLFRTTATVYLIGAITTIIGVGLFIIIIAKIIEIIAYFSLPDDFPTGMISEKGQRKCPNCDKEIPEDASICPYCGKNFNAP